jgi:hypothetical protein
MPQVTPLARSGSTLSAAIAAALLPVCSAVLAADPKVPPAIEPGNRVPVAILTTGFDYTRPEIAARLARDGEGEIIAWDVVGEDRFPYDQTGDTEVLSALATQLQPAAPVSLLAIRVDANDPVSLGKGLAFAARTPARIVLVPMWSPSRETWTVFQQAAQYFTELRIVVRACSDIPPGNGPSVFPRDLNLPNAIKELPQAADPATPLLTNLAALPCNRP